MFRVEQKSMVTAFLFHIIIVIATVFHLKFELNKKEMNH